MSKREVVLDTETTGLETAKGHRIIEIGCVELVNRRLTGEVFHQYIQPDRKVDPAAFKVHGISDEFLKDKPRFGQILDKFIDFIRGAELIIHNAPFDVGFLDHELSLHNSAVRVGKICRVLDTLVLARKLHPGQKNNLDVLCSRYSIDNSKRDKHGALLDSEILADVYLAMTGGQVDMAFVEHTDRQEGAAARQLKTSDLKQVMDIPVIKANTEELKAHELRLTEIHDASGQNCIWIKQEN